MNEPIKFEVIRIKEKMRKNCTCQEPKYEIDIVNNTVECATCGAYVDPLTALYNIFDLEDLRSVSRQGRPYYEMLKGDKSAPSGAIGPEQDGTAPNGDKGAES